ncbi:MAG: hypothetical protein IJL07_01955, partial [Lachnospiraceae bacterium]|nr:hypothetical protein [Lachnospiraceae bacterium]
MKLNEELKQSEKQSREQAEATVSTAKAEADQRVREAQDEADRKVKQMKDSLAEREAKVSNREATVKRIQGDLEGEVQSRVQNNLDVKEELLLRHYKAKNEELERSYKAHTNLYDGFLLGCLLYGVLTTAFKALTSEA